MREYEIKFYRNSRNSRIPVLEYLESLREKDKAKIARYIEFLRANRGYLDEPYSKHIKGKIRELRVDFSKNYHRIFYFTFLDGKIILLHAFLKKTNKTPNKEIKKAEDNYKDTINNTQLYE